jgi:hypothetical protein
MQGLDSLQDMDKGGVFDVLGQVMQMAAQPTAMRAAALLLQARANGSGDGTAKTGRGYSCLLWHSARAVRGAKQGNQSSTETQLQMLAMRAFLAICSGALAGHRGDSRRFHLSCRCQGIV